LRNAGIALSTTSVAVIYAVTGLNRTELDFVERAGLKTHIELLSALEGPHAGA
jgi:hypothetical protein